MLDTVFFHAAFALGNLHKTRELPKMPIIQILFCTNFARIKIFSDNKLMDQTVLDPNMETFGNVDYRKPSGVTELQLGNQIRYII